MHLQQKCICKYGVFRMIKIVYKMTDSIVEKEENAGYQYFLIFQQCFQKGSSSGPYKLRTM